MRLRKRPASTLLLLLPTLSIVTSTVAKDSNAKQVALEASVDEALPLASIAPLAEKYVGTKDAPVDGLDGKPKEGPFVEGKLRKPQASVEDLIPAATQSPTSSSSNLDSKKVTKEEWAKLEMENGGVMQDKDRKAPKVGTDGTEGGVSRKDKDRKEKETETGEKEKKIPEKPKEAPLPNSEQEESKDTAPKEALSTSSRILGAQGLEKPTDLPESPVTPSLPKGEKTPQQTKPKHDSEESDDEDEAGVIQPFHSYILSLTMILFSEVGDKTFLVAALMAMRHDRLLVFSAAFSALIAMTVLSAILGHAMPTLLPKRFTSFAAAILFLVFGAKLLREGLAMSPEEGVGEEMKEVEMELEEKEHLARRNSRRKSDLSPYALEAGRARRSRSNSRLPAPARSPSSSPSRSPSPNGTSLSGILSGLHNLLSLLLSPAWVQTFVMTFLGEWGDRSQIATIAMAAGSDYWWVTGGAISGHAVCTGVAVIGGRAIAGKVSMRVVTLGGAIAFLVFGVIYLLEATYGG